MTTIKTYIDSNRERFLEELFELMRGFTREGTKTILPSKAYAKISMRLVPDQNAEKIARLFENNFISITPAGVKTKVEYL